MTKLQDYKVVAEKVAYPYYAGVKAKKYTAISYKGDVIAPSDIDLQIYFDKLHQEGLIAKISDDKNIDFAEKLSSIQPKKHKDNEVKVNNI